MPDRRGRRLREDEPRDDLQLGDARAVRVPPEVGRRVLGRLQDPLARKDALLAAVERQLRVRLGAESLDRRVLGRRVVRVVGQRLLLRGVGRDQLRAQRPLLPQLVRRGGHLAHLDEDRDHLEHLHEALRDLSVGLLLVPVELRVEHVRGSSDGRVAVGPALGVLLRRDVLVLGRHGLEVLACPCPCNSRRCSPRRPPWPADCP
eukprot:3559028-Prymnesium_polylepis.3